MAVKANEAATGPDTASVPVRAAEPAPASASGSAASPEAAGISGEEPVKRVHWSRQLTKEEAAQYAVKTVLSGKDGWTPGGG